MKSGRDRKRAKWFLRKPTFRSIKTQVRVFDNHYGTQMSLGAAGFSLISFLIIKSALNQALGQTMHRIEDEKVYFQIVLTLLKSAPCHNNCFSFAGRRNPAPQPVPEPGTSSVRLRLRRRRRHQSQAPARNFATSRKRNLATSRRRTGNFGTFLSLDEDFCSFNRISNYFHKPLFLLF